jgi:hypothetical protein
LLDPDVRIVLNRLRRVSVAGYHDAAPPDAAYAQAEATAMLWSCLEGLSCPVLNSMTALGLVGRSSHPLAHAGAAHRCGLLTREYRLTTRARAGDAAAMRALDMPFAAGPPVVGAPAWYGSATCGRPGALWVVGDQVVGALDGVPAAAVLQFARAVGLGFGVVTFEQDAGGRWRWTGFDPLPLYAPPHVAERLAEYLMAHAALA